MNALVRSIVLAATFAAGSAAATAQTPQSVPDIQTADAVHVVVVDTTTAAPPAITMLEYRNADPLRGIFTRPPTWTQCGDQPVIGPMPAPVLGSVAAQPLYAFLLDAELPDVACRKAL